MLEVLLALAMCISLIALTVIAFVLKMAVYRMLSGELDLFEDEENPKMTADNDEAENLAQQQSGLKYGGQKN